MLDSILILWYSLKVVSDKTMNGVAVKRYGEDCRTDTFI